jgi:hypothetical protein
MTITLPTVTEMPASHRRFLLMKENDTVLQEYLYRFLQIGRRIGNRVGGYFQLLGWLQNTNFKANWPMRGGYVDVICPTNGDESV